MFRVQQVIIAGMAATCLLAGCSESSERSDLQREKRQLEDRLPQLEEAVQKATQGKSVLTEAEKAQVGPLTIERNSVRNKIAEIQRELEQMDRSPHSW